MYLLLMMKETERIGLEILKQHFLKKKVRINDKFEIVHSYCLYASFLLTIEGCFCKTVIS